MEVYSNRPGQEASTLPFLGERSYPVLLCSRQKHSQELYVPGGKLSSSSLGVENGILQTPGPPKNIIIISFTVRELRADSGEDSHPRTKTVTANLGSETRLRRSRPRFLKP